MTVFSGRYPLSAVRSAPGRVTVIPARHYSRPPAWWHPNSPSTPDSVAGYAPNPPEADPGSPADNVCSVTREHSTTASTIDILPSSGGPDNRQTIHAPCTGCHHKRGFPSRSSSEKAIINIFWSSGSTSWSKAAEIHETFDACSA